MAEVDVTIINDSASEDSTPATPELSAQDKLIQSLMEPEAPEKQDKPKKPKASVTTTENAATEFPDEDQTPELEEAEEETEGEDEEDSEEADTEEDNEEPDTEEDEDTEEPEEDSEPVYTTPDGEEVTLDELKRGYLRQSDYTKKTQEIAEARHRAVEAFQAVEQHNNVVAEHLHMALGVLEPQLAELASTDWDTLAQTDAYEYAEKRALFDQAQIRYQRLTAAAQQTVAQAQQQKQLKQAEYLRAEQQKLIMAIPDLADPKAGPKLSREIKEYALAGVGLSPEEAGNLTDHRLVVVLNKARLYDQLLSAQSTAGKKKLSKSPQRVARAGQPSSKAEKTSNQRAQLRNRVKSSGSVDDLVELLLAN